MCSEIIEAGKVEYEANDTGDRSHLVKVGRAWLRIAIALPATAGARGWSGRRRLGCVPGVAVFVDHAADGLH